MGLKFGEKLIAKNLNTYRMARPTEEFWTEWKSNKSKMKTDGYSVFKRGGKFFVALYDGGKATFADYVDQEKAAFAAVKKELEQYLFGFNGIAPESDLEESIRIVRTALDRYDFEALDGLLNNWNRVVEDAENAVFDEYFNKKNKEKEKMKETERKILDPKALSYRFVIQDREAGNIITGFNTLKEAEAELEKYEEEDRKNGTYVEGFYEIAERDENGDYEKVF